MANNKKDLKILALIFNVVILVFELIGFFLSFENLVKHQRMLILFLTGGNSLLGICSFIYVLSLVRDLNGKGNVPKAVHVLKFVATSAVMFTTVNELLIIISSAAGHDENVFCFLPYGSSFFTDLMCPALAIISFLFFEHSPKLRFPCTVFAALYAALHAGFIFLLNYSVLIPYPFFRICEEGVMTNVIWTVISVGGSYVTGIVIWGLNKLLGGK